MNRHVENKIQDFFKSSDRIKQDYNLEINRGWQFQVGCQNNSLWAAHEMSQPCADRTVTTHVRETVRGGPDHSSSLSMVLCVSSSPHVMGDIKQENESTRS